jgi:hypothetical protein
MSQNRKIQQHMVYGLLANTYPLYEIFILWQSLILFLSKLKLISADGKL